MGLRHDTLTWMYTATCFSVFKHETSIQILKMVTGLRSTHVSHNIHAAEQKMGFNEEIFVVDLKNSKVTKGNR